MVGRKKSKMEESDKLSVKHNANKLAWGHSYLTSKIFEINIFKSHDFIYFVYEFDRFE